MKIIRLIILFIAFSNTSIAQTVEALGVPIKTSNLLWNLHPSNDPVNNRVLPLFAKKLNGDIVSVLIDLKNITDNGISTERFSLITVNTSKDYYKKFEFIPQDNTSSPAPSFGNPWVRFEGPNKKIYISTAEGGGQLLEYDIENETATDLGSPFLINNRIYGIYSLAIGSDSAIYGGSFSNGLGSTFTFRYDPKTKTFWKYLLPIDNQLQYVSYVGGDAENNYVICGQSTWVVYAINRSTNQVKKLLTSATRIYGIENTSCGCYITVDQTKYKLSAFAATPQNTPAGCVSLNFTHTYVDPSLPKTYWNEMMNTYYYKRQNEAEKSFVFDLPVQAKKVQYVVNYNDSIIVGNGSTYSYTFLYDPASANPAKAVGDNKLISVHGMISHDNKIFMSGYPSGILEQWDPAKEWTYGTQTLTFEPPPIKSPQSNPTLLANYRTDGFGIHELHIAGTTDNGYIVVTGNNIRTDTSVSMGSYKNGVAQQLVNADRFADYFVKGSTISYSKKTAYILAQRKNGYENWVYEYDPEKNDVIDSFAIFTSPIKRVDGLIMLPNEELFGQYTNLSGVTYLYTFDIKTKSITWQQTFVTSGNISYKLGPDEQVWFTTNPISPRITVFNKFNPYTKQVTTGPSLTNPDINVNSSVSDIAFFKNDIYIGGYLNLMRIKNVVAPLPPNLTPEQKITYLFESYKKINISCN